MNVGQLKKTIENMPDDIRLYVIVGDHEAQEIWFSDWFVTAPDPIRHSRKHMTEFFGDEYLDTPEQKVRALVADI